MPCYGIKKKDIKIKWNATTFVWYYHPLEKKESRNMQNFGIINQYLSKQNGNQYHLYGINNH